MGFQRLSLSVDRCVVDIEKIEESRLSRLRFRARENKFPRTPKFARMGSRRSATSALCMTVCTIANGRQR